MNRRGGAAGTSAVTCRPGRRSPTHLVTQARGSPQRSPSSVPLRRTSTSTARRRAGYGYRRRPIPARSRRHLTSDGRREVSIPPTSCRAPTSGPSSTSSGVSRVRRRRAGVHQPAQDQPIRGRMHAVEVFLYVRAVADVPSGVYHYDVQSADLRLIDQQSREAVRHEVSAMLRRCRNTSPTPMSCWSRLSVSIGSTGSTPARARLLGRAYGCRASYSNLPTPVHGNGSRVVCHGCDQRWRSGRPAAL